ncbi:DHA2 family efflux MFS transporter permease subunit [Cephaloticoccus capnophilus]|nr:DHA2 family efflux MFS transporter permease subunit [Cephaloticoccus capnophilus]
MSSASAEQLSESPAPSDSAKRILPWLVAIALFMEHLDSTILNTAIPAMAQSLHVAPLALRSVSTSYMLALAVFIPISGWMADRFGTRRVFFAAVGLFALGSLVCGLSLNVQMLVAARILQGMGGAMMTPVGRVALVRTFPRSDLLRTMNYVIVPALVGPMVGPLIGGLIVHWLHWRIIFFLNLPLAIFGLWLVHRTMPNYLESDTPPLDRTGFLLFGAGIALLSYALQVFGEHTMATAPLSLLTALSLLLLALYGWHSRRVENPVLALWLLRARTLQVSVIAGGVSRLGIGGMPFLLPLLYQIGLGFTPWEAGLLMMPNAVAAILMKISSGRVLARLGHRTTLISNTAIVGLTIGCFSLVGPGVSVWALAALSFVQGFFISLQFTSINSLVYAEVEDRDAAKASSIASTAQQLTFSFGTALAALLAGWFLSGLDQTNPAQILPALHRVFLTMGILTILSSLCYLRLRPSDGSNISGHGQGRRQ